VTVFLRLFALLPFLLALGSTGAAAQFHERTVRDALGRGVTPVSVENEYGSIAVTTWGCADVDLAPFRDDEGNYRGSVRGGGPLLRVKADEGTTRLHTRTVQ